MNARDFIKDYLKRSLKRSHVLTGVILAFIIGSAFLYAGEIFNSLIFFNPGDTASSSQVNSNFQNLANAIDQNREGFACRIDTFITVPTSGATPDPFVCQTVLEDNLSTGSGTSLFVSPEKGIYQIHRSLYWGTDSAASSAAASGIDMDSFSKIYVNGTLEGHSREFFELDTGHTVDIKLIDPSGTLPTYYILQGSLVFVKRIF